MMELSRETCDDRILMPSWLVVLVILTLTMQKQDRSA